VPAVCVAGRPCDQRTLQGSRISIRNEGCASKRQTVKLFDYSPPLINSVVWTHKCCICNEVVALRQRHQLDDGSTYTSTLDLKKMLAGRVKRLYPVSEDVIISNASGGKRRLLEEAKASLVVYPLETRDGKVRMFLKDDKSHELTYTTPRCIQYRSKRYCLPLATYLHPLEQYLYSWNDISGTPIFAKSRNMQQRGSDIQAKMEFFFDPVAISLDHSKFDSHVNKELLRLEHWFYRKCFPGDRMLAKLLKMQELNCGSTKNGTKYVTPFTRMSGDQNTGSGNSLINYAMTYALEKALGIRMCYYIDGDDYIIFTERSNLCYIRPEWFEQFGMKTKVEGVSDFMEGIEFCQSRPVFNGKGYTMVRNPIRMMSRLNWYVGKIHPKHRENYLYSVGLCELSLGMGLPIGQFLGDKLAKMGGKYVVTPSHYSANKMAYKPGKAKLIEPSLTVRTSYELAWGITVKEQLDYEQMSIVSPHLTNFADDFEEEPYALSSVPTSWSERMVERDKIVKEDPRRLKVGALMGGTG